MSLVRHGDGSQLLNIEHVNIYSINLGFRRILSILSCEPTFAAYEYKCDEDDEQHNDETKHFVEILSSSMKLTHDTFA